MVFRYKYLIFIALLFIISCGNKRGPTGGPVDTVSPSILYTIPLEYEQIANNEIVIAFSKPMDKASVLSGLHISPASIDRKISWKKNTLHINLTSRIPDDTNVTVFLNKSIRCDRRNELKDHILLIFRNGNLQQYSVSGNIICEEFDIYAYPVSFTLLDKDSLLVYHREINEPNYRFDYLNPGKHTINAYIDTNNNRRFDFGIDPSFSHSFELPITSNLHVHLIVADTLRPRATSIASPYRDQVNILLNKPIQMMPHIEISDDSTSTVVRILHTLMIDRTIHLLTAPLDTLTYNVRISALYDARGNITPESQNMLHSRAIPDTTRLTIHSTSPRNGAVIRDEKVKLSVTFDKIVFAKDIAVSLREVETNKYISISATDIAGFTINFDIHDTLRSFSTYQLTIYARSMDNSQNTMSGDTIIQFIVIN
jgi:hypothetical protein